MLLLTGPYGGDNGTGISLRAVGPVDLDLVREACEGFSCHPPAIPRIQSCLLHSGRYDCRLQSYWFRDCYLDVTAAFARANVALCLQEGELKNPDLLRLWGKDCLG